MLPDLGGYWSCYLYRALGCWAGRVTALIVAANSRQSGAGAPRRSTDARARTNLGRPVERGPREVDGSPAYQLSLAGLPVQACLA